MEGLPTVRPRSAGEILDATLAVYRANPETPLGLMVMLAVLALPCALAVALVAALMVAVPRGPLVMAPVAALLVCLPFAWVLAAQVLSADAVLRGRRLGVRESLRLAARRLVVVAPGATVLLLAMTAAGALLDLATMAGDGPAVAVLAAVCLVGAAVAGPGGLWLPAAALERVGPVEAWRRGVALVAGAWMRSTGLVLVVAALSLAAAVAPALALAAVGWADAGAAGAGPAAALFLFTAVPALPLLPIGLTVHYHDRRVRAEGMDLEDAAVLAVPTRPA